MRRTALADHELRGKRIAKGDKVVVWYMSANYDETVFDDPHAFDIARDPNPHLGFGGGPPLALYHELARRHLAFGQPLVELGQRLRVADRVADRAHYAACVQSECYASLRYTRNRPVQFQGLRV